MTRVPGAVQHEVMHRRTGTQTAQTTWVPDQRCSSAPRGALLHRIRDAMWV
jgi:hypothetical protein